LKASGKATLTHSIGRSNPRESVLRVNGEVKSSKQAPGGKEILIKDYEILSEAELHSKCEE